jgi:PIN domain nuclease of toxin-antitoxin system
MLSARAKRVLEGRDEHLLISVATAWEIATKYRLGKLPQVESLIDDFSGKLRAMGFIFMPITVEHSFLAGSFTMNHKDPFDRLIAAQARIEKIPLLSNDAAFDQFPIERIW